MLDFTEILVIGGNGGSGKISFHREKYVPRGGPDGGDGGIGGSVYIEAQQQITSLDLFRHKKVWSAESGETGGSKKRHGRKGKDLIIAVPIGTVVREINQGNNEKNDLVKLGQRILVARGGEGGRGNPHFASATNRIPKLGEAGEKGEERRLFLELKILADVGIIGCPGVGKSSLLSKVSEARPKIGDYPFTTREPILGVVEVGWKTFVLAEIPGIIEGAYLGRGLGLEFLRHVERTKVLIHVVDGTSRKIKTDYENINKELRRYNTALLKKPQIIAINKKDLILKRDGILNIKKKFSKLKEPVHFISAYTGEGVEELMKQVSQLLDRLAAEENTETPSTRKTFVLRPKKGEVELSREGNTFRVRSASLERILKMIDLKDWESKMQFLGLLEKRGIRKRLVKAGARPGDKVLIGDLEWELP